MEGCSTIEFGGGCHRRGGRDGAVSLSCLDYAL